jgi:hypothetical protein
MSVLPEEGLVNGVAYLIDEANILSGRKAFGVGMADCYFLRLRVNADFMVGPFKEPFGEMAMTLLNCQSLTQQTWSIRK